MEGTSSSQKIARVPTTSAAAYKTEFNIQSVAGTQADKATDPTTSVSTSPKRRKRAARTILREASKPKRALGALRPGEGVAVKTVRTGKVTEVQPNETTDTNDESTNDETDDNHMPDVAPQTKRIKAIPKSRKGVRSQRAALSQSKEAVSTVAEKANKAEWNAEGQRLDLSFDNYCKKDNSDGSKPKPSKFATSIKRNNSLSAEMSAIRPNRKLAAENIKQALLSKQKLPLLHQTHNTRSDKFNPGGDGNLFDPKSRRQTVLPPKVDQEIKANSNKVRFDPDNPKIMYQTVSKKAAYIAGFGAILYLKNILAAPEAHPNIEVTEHEEDNKLIVVRIQDVSATEIKAIVEARAKQKKLKDAAQRKSEKDLAKKRGRR